MEYRVTALRRRPQNLQQLSGQSFVQQTLHNAITSGRIAHSYLFSGPRGVGKTSTARILARSLNCEHGPSSTPCAEQGNECTNCRDILGGKAMDVIEIDGASHTGVDDIREIKDEVLYAPSSSRYKVFIIDEVHMLSNSAFNALLKTIEEPPEYIVFIFATTEIHKVPLTVRSRCQHYNFHLVALEQIEQNLAAACGELGLQYRDEAILWVARQAKGSMRDAYTLFDQVASFCAGEVLSLELIQQKMGLLAIDQLGKLCDALIEMDLQAAMELYQQMIHSGTSLEQLLTSLCEYLRALLLLQSQLSERQLLLLLPYPPAHYSAKARQAWNSEQLCHILDRCFSLYRNLRYSINEHFELELLLFELTQLRYYSSSAYQLQRLETLTEQLQKGLPNYDAQISKTIDKKNEEGVESAPQNIVENTQANFENSHSKNYPEPPPKREVAPQENLQARPSQKDFAEQTLKSVPQENARNLVNSENSPNDSKPPEPEPQKAKFFTNAQGKPNLAGNSANADSQSGFSNVEEHLRKAAIQSLQSGQLQWAQYLEPARWTWQPQTQTLEITLQTPQAQQELKKHHSLLLRHLQEILNGSQIYPIMKLSLLLQNEAAVQIKADAQTLQPPLEKKKPQNKTLAKPLAQDQVQTEKQEPASGAVVPPVNNKPVHQSPEQPTAPEKAARKKFDKAKSVEFKNVNLVADQTAQTVDQTELAAQPIEPQQNQQSPFIAEQVINDYSTLPQDIQILQKVFCAQVKEVYSPKQNNQN